MARLPDELIERLKNDISLLRLIDSQGYQPKRQGKDYAIHCPFHKGDDTPSLVISPARNLFNCFGCGTAGSVIDWVIKTQGVSFRRAVEILQHDVGVLVSAGTKTVKQNTTATIASPLVANADDQQLLQDVVAYYHDTLKQSPDALDYLASRGLNDPTLINTFKLGYANRSLGYRLPEKNRKAGAEIRTRLQTLGLLRASGHEHFTGSLVVPVMDSEGVVQELYGRKVGSSLRKGTANHLYLPGPHEGIWNAAGLVNTKEVILCEALIDAMTFWVQGFKHVTASYGTQGFTAAHIAAFKQHDIERVLIAYDRDDAGDRAADELAKKLTTDGIDCFRVLFPKGMDANDYALNMSPPAKALGLAIRKAQWLGNGQAPTLTTATPETVEDSVVEQGVSTTPIKPVVAEQPTIDDTQATPLPPPPPTVEAEITDNEITCALGDRHYRVRGFDKNSSHDQLKINLLVRKDDAFHTDKLDLYASKQRQVFINQASVELGVKDEVIKVDLGKVLLKLEEIQGQQQTTNDKPLNVLTDKDRQAALALLQAPDLLNRILTDFDHAGVVGEETNKLVGYLACVSRQLDKPLAVMIQSSSAAGKSSLMESILALMPEEDRVQYSAMTGQSLFYMGETNLKHKILAIAEEEGASNASYALKLLQSEGEVSIASTGKDDTTGNLITKTYTVEGPVMLFLTTTAIEIDEELLNRCVVLSVNESREQTQAIHQAQRQRRTLAGLQAKLDKAAIINIHRNAQRLLKPLQVINSYADQLTFLDDKTRTRRDHEKYLTLIDAITLLHQYQREIKMINHDGDVIEYIDVTLTDIEHANRLAHDVLGKTLDELPPQTRKLLIRIRQMVTEACQAQGITQSHYRFSRKTIRDYSGWGNTQLKIHCHRLEEMEYLLIHRGGRGQSLEYELLYDGDHDEDLHLMGLIDPKKLRYDTKKSGVKAKRSGSSRPQVGGVSGPSRGAQNATQPSSNNGYEELQFDCVENAYLGTNTSPQSCRTDTSPLAAKGKN